MFLTKALNNTDPAVIGLTGALNSHGGRGWTFISYVQRGHGRLLRETAEQAIPRWFTGYVVDAKGPQEAIALTEAYRAGKNWAAEEAAKGMIRTVRTGKVS